MTTSVSSLRCFFAIDLPPQSKQALVQIVTTLQKTYVRDAIRWIKTDNFHITLQFMEKIKAEDLPTLIQTAQPVLAEMKAFSVNLGPLQLFPSLHHPRNICLSVEPAQALTTLAVRLGECIHALGYPIETRHFRAHITLGKIQFHPHKDHFSLSVMDTSAVDKLTVGEVVLYRSEPSEHGSHYTALERFKLAETI